MTRAHKATLDPQCDPMCECGREHQTLSHLVYRCPNVTPPTPDILTWENLPPVNSEALLATSNLTRDDLVIWERVCKRALSVISVLSLPSDIVEWKDHVVTTSRDANLAYCGKCLVS